jgi:hypothetical protein
LTLGVALAHGPVHTHAPSASAVILIIVTHHATPIIN